MKHLQSIRLSQQKHKATNFKCWVYFVQMITIAVPLIGLYID